MAGRCQKCIGPLPEHQVFLMPATWEELLYALFLRWTGLEPAV